jgi:hypothetical protein
LSPPLANAILDSTPSLSYDGRKTKATNEASEREPNACVQRPLIRRRKRDASIPERFGHGSPEGNAPLARGLGDVPPINNTLEGGRVGTIQVFRLERPQALDSLRADC